MPLQGAKTAAVRKLQHELGIDPADLPASKFKFLTRLHYCAADVGADGRPTGWGEHEMDYILFARADVKIQPNSEEVQAVKYVGKDELAALMEPSHGLLWSPWFRIICDRFLADWWQDLDRTLSTDEAQSLETVHKILD